MSVSAPRPTGGYPGWASGTSGAAATTQPDALTQALGWGIGQSPPSSFMNWLHALAYQWIAYLDQGRATPFLGDGSDGTIILGGNAATGVPTVYVMSRHMLFQDIAIGLSGTLDTNGFVPFVRGAWTGVSGTIRCNGQAGSTGVSGSVGLMGLPVAGPLRGGFGAGTGITGGGTRVFGEAPINSFGGAGGAGGSGTAGAGLAGGTCVSPSGVWRKFPEAAEGIVRWATPTGGMTGAYLRGGAGGGEGAGDSGAGGGQGAGGAGAGMVLVPCSEVNFIGTVQVRGGTGGASVGGCGAGGGGGGGWGAVSYAVRTQLSVAFDSTPGAGGPKAAGSSGSTGAFGSTGGTGLVEIALFG